MCKNIFALKMLLIILNFHAQDVTKVCGCVMSMSRNGYAKGNFLKRISTYLTKCNKTNMCHSDIQKHVSSNE